MTTVSRNYVAMNVESTTCPGGNLRLSVEQEGSQCYQEGSTGCVSTCDILGEESFCVADMVQLAPDGRNGTMAMPTSNETAADPAMGTAAPVGAAPEPNGTMTATTPPGNGTADSTMGADSPAGNVTAPPTEDNVTSPGDGMDTTRIDVAFEIVNDMMIRDAAEVNASGLGAAFPVYVEELVTNLTATARRQLLLQQRRRLEISLVPGSAWIYEIIPVGCVPDNRTASNMTSNFTTTCHEAMGKYELLLSADEDPIAVRTTYARETRAGIDDGTFQKVLLEVDPNSPLVLGPSIEPKLPETEAPMSSDDMPTPSQPAGPPTLFPTAPKPKCPPGRRSKSKSKSKSRTKGAKGKGGRAGASKASSHKGRKMMRKFRRAHGGGTGHRNLDGHGQVDNHGADEHGNITPEFGGEHHHPVDVDENGLETTHFANTPKEHDDGDYYMFEQGEYSNYLNGHLEEIVDEECEEPDYYYEEASSRSKGKGGYYDTERTQSYGNEEKHRRQLLEGSGLPRIHGPHRSSHRISDMRAVLAAELEEQG